MNKSLLSSKKMDYETPNDFFEKLNKILNFEIDLAATSKNTKCKTWISEEYNSLSEKCIWDYEGWCWLNPPYGREMHKWIAKAYNSKAKICMLIPSRTDTSYQHTFVFNANAIIFIKGRLTFVGSLFNAPFPCQLVFFGELTRCELTQLKKLNLGKVMENQLKIEVAE
jgi:site-specific DNA-methyltransferase (adenine-specific)